MSKLIDIFVVYQENGLPHEKTIEVPTGLSNADFMNFVNNEIGEAANIINMINLDSLNRQKSAAAPAAAADEGRRTFEGGRPERRSDSKPRFGQGTRPYGNRSGGSGGASRGGDRGERPTGGYAGRSPRDGAQPGRGGSFGERPSRGAGRDSRMSAGRAKRPAR